MEEYGINKINPLESFNYKNKTVLLRLDLNSPIDRSTKKIAGENRIIKSVPTLKYLLAQSAKVAVIAHQGDTLDYNNLIPMKEHAQLLSELTGQKIEYIDDVCGLYAIDKVKNLNPREGVLLGNLRYLTEEVSTFENDVKLDFDEMKNTWLMRSLGEICDIYVNDAFSAAHRNCPSMTGFQKILPSAAGKLFFNEYSALNNLKKGAKRDVVFVLGGAKISDAFGMINEVLEKKTADRILTCGITGQIMLIASGYSLGRSQKKYFHDRNLLKFTFEAEKYLDRYPEKIMYPQDLAYEDSGRRVEIEISNLCREDKLYMDIGQKTAGLYKEEIMKAGTVFANGPPGVYEDDKFSSGSRTIIDAIAKSKAFTVIGGGDTVSMAEKFADIKDFNYVCTAGGAMVRFLSGKKLPLIEAMEDSYVRYTGK